MATVYIVRFYAQGARRAGDCYGDFLATREEAIEVGKAEIARVAAIPVAERMPTIDWAARFTIRKTTI